MLEKSIVALRQIQGLIQGWVLPFTCILCGQKSRRQQDLCSACLQDLPIIAQSCPSCANKSPSSLTCGACLQQAPPFSAAHALFAYEEPVISMILALKFRQRLAYARIFGELLTEKIKTTWYRCKPLPELLIPVPLHWQRLQERGFNQALELARPVAASLPIRLDWQSARRLENTPAQISLSAAERRANLKDAFVVEGEVRGKTVAILDDVLTTGSTATALSRALLKQGAEKVEVWCCARAGSG